jgi:hypothetical protein
MIPDQNFGPRELIPAPNKKVKSRIETIEPRNSRFRLDFEPKNPRIEPTLSR